jgi:hypothetical protein
MHAALILLNCVFAFGACLGVELDPVLGVLLAPADAVEPLVKQPAAHGRVLELVA